MLPFYFILMGIYCNDNQKENGNKMTAILWYSINSSFKLNRKGHFASYVTLTFDYLYKLNILSVSRKGGLLEENMLDALHDFRGQHSWVGFGKTWAELEIGRTLVLHSNIAKLLWKGGDELCLFREHLTFDESEMALWLGVEGWTHLSIRLRFSLLLVWPFPHLLRNKVFTEHHLNNGQPLEIVAIKSHYFLNLQSNRPGVVDNYGT